MTTFLMILLGAGAQLALLLMFFYNRLVKMRNMVKEGWSGIEVQLKRRSNLIPNLVETIKGYVDHERDLLKQVTELRNNSLSSGDMAARQRIEGQLGAGLARLLAVAENYPDLKANQNFLDLQQQLATVEQEIQMARRYYNGTVRNLNIQIEAFPSNFIADWFHFEPAEFFEIDEPAVRDVPRVTF